MGFNRESEDCIKMKFDAIIDGLSEAVEPIMLFFMIIYLH